MSILYCVVLYHVSFVLHVTFVSCASFVLHVTFVSWASFVSHVTFVSWASFVSHVTFVSWASFVSHVTFVSWASFVLIRCQFCVIWSSIISPGILWFVFFLSMYFINLASETMKHFTLLKNICCNMSQNTVHITFKYFYGQTLLW